MQRYNSNESASNYHLNLLDLDSSLVNRVEQDLLADYFWQEGGLCDPDFLSKDRFDPSCLDMVDLFSCLNSPVRLETDGEGRSQAEESHHNYSCKNSEATKDTTNQAESKQMAEASSSIGKRAPSKARQSSPLENHSEVTSATYGEDSGSAENCVNKGLLSKVYNYIVDGGCCSQTHFDDLNEMEQRILEAMLRLRLILGKSIKPKDQKPLFADLTSLNKMLSKSVSLKKRSEELLKKNFKTVLKIMLDKFKQELPKKTYATESKTQFAVKYFGSQASHYDRIFKCIQISQNLYKEMFSFPHFKQDFIAASQQFKVQFVLDRTFKTENLISQIYSDLMAGKPSKLNLRTPWTTQEAELSASAMAQLY